MLNESFDSLGERSHPRQWMPFNTNASIYLVNQDAMYYLNLPEDPEVAYWPRDPEWSKGAYWLGDLPEWSEDLLTALNDMQRQQADLARELQRERGEKEEDRSIAVALSESPKQYSEAVREMAGREATDDELATQKLVENAEKQLATFIWRWAKAIASNVFVGTFLCQIIFLFLLWDLKSRQRQKWTTRRTAGKDRGKTNSWARIFPRGLLAASRVEVISGLFLLHMAVFSISSLTVELQTRFTGNVACGVALMLLFSIYCILEPYAQHI
jgi:hypothetical protein